MNQVMLSGNIASDLKVSTTTSGIKRCAFSLAYNDPYRKEDGKKKTDFFYVILWKDAAESAERLLSKGRGVEIIGRLQNRRVDLPDGTFKTVTEIMSNTWNFPPASGNGTSNGNAAAGNTQKQSKPAPSNTVPPDIDDDFSGDDFEPTPPVTPNKTTQPKNTEEINLEEIDLSEDDIAPQQPPKQAPKPEATKKVESNDEGDMESWFEED